MPKKPEFEHLVAEHSSEVFAYLWRMVGDNHDAEDCLQDTFVRAFRAYPRLDDDANTRAWLYKIATNVARTQLKKRSRLASKTAEVDPGRIPSDADSLDEGLDRQLSLDAVLAAVKQLPHKQRAALMMRKYQGLAYAEIAAALNSSQDAARANVYQALRKLRRSFAEKV